MARLPIPGSDDNTWGDILNTYLEVSLNNDGTIQTSALSSAGGELTANKGVAGGYASLNGSGQVPSGQLPPNTLASDTDVNISGPINNQVLTYNSGTSKWINQASSGGVSLNANPANIQPLGTQAAGSTGLAADASHVHPMPTLNQINSPTSSVNLNSKKITNLANGTASADAAAFGQIPTSLPPSGAAGGDLTGTYPNPTVTATANFKTQVETVRLDQMASPTSSVDLNSQKITDLANGAAATDAAAFGQIPNSLPPSGAAGGDLTGTYPNPTVTATANFKTQVETVRLDQMAAPTSSVDFNNEKITSLANGTAATDAAAFGQIPASLPPSGTAGGDLTGTYPNPTVTSTANFKTQVETVRLDQMASPTSSVGLNSQKITSLANGTSAQDAAAFGQIPTSAGSIGGLLAANNLSDVANANTSRNNLTAAQWFAPTGVKTSGYTAAAGDFVPVDTTSGSVTITLPTAPADKTRIGVKMIIQGSTNTVAINAGGSDVFNKAGGGTTFTLTLLNQGVLLQYASSTSIWYVQADDLALSQLDSRYLNQSTTGSAAKWTTPRLLAGNSVDGSADVPFANKFLVQGTTDSGLTGAQFLGALSTGIMVVTTTTGVVTSVAAPAGTIVGTSDTQTLTNKRITKRVLALSAGSATPAINTDSYDVVHITAQSAAITSFTTNLTGTPVDGDTLRISITDDGSARAITWGASFEASTVALPTTTVINARLDVGFFWNTATTKWRCVAVA